jgi:hypothetical protein
MTIPYAAATTALRRARRSLNYRPPHHLHLTRCHEKTRLWSTPSGLPLSHSSIYLAAAPLCCAR